MPFVLTSVAVTQGICCFSHAHLSEEPRSNGVAAGFVIEQDSGWFPVRYAFGTNEELNDTVKVALSRAFHKANGNFERSVAVCHHSKFIALTTIGKVKKKELLEHIQLLGRVRTQLLYPRCSSIRVATSLFNSIRNWHLQKD